MKAKLILLKPDAPEEEILITEEHYFNNEFLFRLEDVQYAYLYKGKLGKSIVVSVNDRERDIHYRAGG